MSSSTFVWSILVLQLFAESQQAHFSPTSTHKRLALRTDCIYVWQLSLDGEVKRSVVLLVLSFTLMHLATAVAFRANSESWPTAGLLSCLKLLSVAHKDSLFKVFIPQGSLSESDSAAEKLPHLHDLPYVSYFLCSVCSALSRWGSYITSQA